MISPVTSAETSQQSCLCNTIQRNKSITCLALSVIALTVSASFDPPHQGMSGRTAGFFVATCASFMITIWNKCIN